MTNGALEKNAHKFNQRFVNLIYGLLLLAVCTATGGVYAIQNNNAITVVFCAVVTAALIVYASNVPRATDKKAILTNYIMSMLEKASEKKRLRLIQDAQIAELKHRLETQRMERLLRNRKTLRNLKLGRYVAKNEAAITTCEQSYNSAASSAAVMRAELEGINKSFNEFVKKAEKAIATHVESKEESLLEKTEFARTINGLVQNASKL